MFKRGMKAATLVTLLMGSSLTMAACSNGSATGNADNKTLTVVFLPGDSAKEVTGARQAFSKEISKATGKKVNILTTTDYNVAIQSIASGKAQIALLGPDAYVEANAQNRQVQPLVTATGASGTLKDAQYHSYIMVPKNKASHYKVQGKYRLKKVAGQTISFVSATSTSGFAVPAGAIKTALGVKQSSQLQQSGGVFKKVLYGGSHQGSALNLFNGDADVAAFDDIDMTPYGELIGNPNKAGVIYKVKKDAPAPFTKVAGAQSQAIAAYPVQNEPLVANRSQVSETDAAKIIQRLTSKQATNNPNFFAPINSKTHGIFTKKGKMHFIKVTDRWYEPTHKIIGK
ncbi:phosphate/phosphite/phosphonate ABC transporter substrate-binding protein [Secundilactobacillus kimchicus]|uniref:phosphate/phosphite/phosphonate ABC transporter substrate-binding protein n=1 Tax=Secundilactobacillus kimchicus TaxID=528209 RepID=UPI00207872D3|nr:phosphate/phosphite/phosphonate ABC transporter substrate-binding protein [Secundilactobacillus kimchicus]